ncbi:MAG: tRNA (N6-isopentenyl adenosine(37)-C2)-methylthiotransferase MiaB [Defluviitaleaceae bacterium]|nr:tRNA (N6-isopentenyl adenosine(37)-C2)-methylthiotransferase MiaB [Defluviitaleaceae bacterium]
MKDFRALLAGKNLSFFIRTYGCQMNERDSEKMAGLLEQIGFVAAKSKDVADIVIYNTCCVRESAEDKVFGHLSREKSAKAQRPFILAIGGCMPQQPEMADLLREKHKYADIVFGTGNRHRLPEFLWRVIENGERNIVDITEGENELPEITDVPVTTREFSHKAGVNIMYGCDNFCSYCIVPYVRGREKSRAAEDVLAEIRALADDGVREIMLLGQNVNSYRGKICESVRVVSLPAPTLQNDSLASFPELLHLAHEVEGIKRIRFMTSHPKDFSDELIDAMQKLPNVCKHVHLPLQAGSTRVLADMNRFYTKEQYLALAEKLYAAMPEIAITTDIIVGYPGETDEDFEDTLDVVRRVRFAGAFTFIYSKRSGTPAATRTDLIPRKTANERFDRLTAELYPIMTARNESKIGQIIDVMVEEVRDDASNAYKARGDDHTLVHFTAETGEFVAGDIVPVRIDVAKTFYVSGCAASDFLRKSCN